MSGHRTVHSAVKQARLRKKPDQKPRPCLGECGEIYQKSTLSNRICPKCSRQIQMRMLGYGKLARCNGMTLQPSPKSRKPSLFHEST